MILYAVKTDAGYLRDKGEGGVFLTNLTSASVFSDQKSAGKLQKKYGDGYIVELTLTERAI